MPLQTQFPALYWKATPPTIKTSELPGATVGDNAVQKIVVSGTAPVIFEVTAGALPAGRSLNALTGEITGIYTTEEVAVFTITATNSVGTDLREYTQTINALVITDDFNREDGAVGNDWQGVVGTIVSNALTLLPTVSESELVSNPGFEIGNPATGWSADGESLGRTGNAHSGNWAGEIIATDTNEMYIYQDVSVVPGQWYVVSGWLVRASAGGFMNLKAESPTGVLTNQSTPSNSSVYLEHRVVALAQDTTMRIRGNAASVAVGVRMRFDDASLRAASAIFLYQVLTAGRIRIQAKFTLPAIFHRAGVAHAIDDTHYVLAYIEDKVRVNLLRIEGTDWSIVATNGITYSDGATLELVRNETGLYSVEYGGNEVIGTTDVGYADMSAADRACIFASVTSVVVDDFSAERF